MHNFDDNFDSTFVGAPGDKILLPLMGYPAERDAIFIALVVAEYFGSDLFVLHIENKSSKIEDYFQKQLSWLREEAKKMNITIDIKIQNGQFAGRPEKAILSYIDELAPRLTIMMSRRKGLFQKFSGSIAERVARRSPNSVLIIRSPIKDWTVYGDHIQPQKIVVPIGAEAPYEIFATQLAIAVANAGKSKDAEIILLRVIVVPETVPIIPEDDKIILEEEKQFIKQAGRYSTLMLFPMNTKVIIGRDVGRSVSHYVNKEQADLVILGVPYLPRRFFGLYGTDTNEIFQKSRCPVMMLFYKPS